MDHSVANMMDRSAAQSKFEGTVIDMRDETFKMQQKMKEQDEYLKRQFAEATSPEKKMRKI